MQAMFHSRRFWVVLVAALCVLVFVIRLAAPSDLEGYAQHRNVGYVMDMMSTGNWLAQYDIQGRILSKPPLHTWTIAPFAAVLGVDRFALTLPSLLAVLALALLVLDVGRRRFGLLAGGFAAIAVVLAPLMTKHIALVRSDALFALLIAAAAVVAFNAWEKGGRGWTLFWVLAALATLTKGPLGVVLAAAGLLAYFWERRTEPATRPPRGSHVAGLTAFFALTLGWFVLALIDQGFDLIDKMFFDELLGQATGARKDSIPGENLLKPTLFLLGRFLPFSLFFFYGLWRVFRAPAADAAERRFERFLVCWVLTGLLIFSLAAHHRPDLLLPLWPACALLAGREIARLAERIGSTRLVPVTGAVVLVMLLGIAAQYHMVWGARAQNVEVAETTRDAARALVEHGIDPHTLHHFGTQATFQMYLGTYRPWLPRAELEQLLATTGESVLVARGPRARDEITLAGEGRTVETVFVWPPDAAEAAAVRIYRVAPAN